MIIHITTHQRKFHLRLCAISEYFFAETDVPEKFQDVTDRVAAWTRCFVFLMIITIKHFKKSWWLLLHMIEMSQRIWRTGSFRRWTRSKGPTSPRCTSRRTRTARQRRSMMEASSKSSRRSRRIWSHSTLGIRFFWPSMFGFLSTRHVLKANVYLSVFPTLHYYLYTIPEFVVREN